MKIESGMVSSMVTLSDGERVRVLQGGRRERPCLFFYHSVLTGAALWSAQMTSFSADYFVAALDSRGHGQSEAAQWDGSMDRLVRDVPEVLAALDVERCHFVGLSLGGIVGYGLARAYPGVLDSLFIASARPDGNETFRQPWPGRAEQARREGVGALAPETLARWFPRGQADLQAKVEPWIRRTSSAGFEKSARALQTYDYADWAQDWSKPVTLLAGALDGVLPDVMAEVADAVPKAELVVLPDTGHLPNVEEPGRFNQALARHLARTML